MDLVVYDDDEKRYVPWAVALSALVGVAVLAGLIAFLIGRQTSGDEVVGGVSAPQAATAPTPAQEPRDDVTSEPTEDPPAAGGAGPASAPACVEALQQAEAALERSVAIEEALAEQTRVMDELLAERVSTEQALDEVLPVLTEGATDRKRFLELMADYEQTRRACTD